MRCRPLEGWFTRVPAKVVVPEAAIEYNPTPPQTLSPAAAAVDPMTLATRENGLAAQLAALEARTASVSVDALAASGQAGRAEAILIAFAARRAIERGMPLGYLEEELRKRFGTAEPRATLAITQSARQPLTLEDLRQGLDANSAELLSGQGRGSAIESGPRIALADRHSRRRHAPRRSPPTG